MTMKTTTAKRALVAAVASGSLALSGVVLSTAVTSAQSTYQALSPNSLAADQMSLTGSCIDAGTLAQDAFATDLDWYANPTLPPAGIWVNGVWQPSAYLLGNYGQFIADGQACVPGNQLLTAPSTTTPPATVPPTTDAPPTTSAPTTVAPSTTAPPTTVAPTTVPPTTTAPTTVPPTTVPPTTVPPTTTAPTTAAPAPVLGYNCVVRNGIKEAELYWTLGSGDLHSTNPWGGQFTQYNASSPEYVQIQNELGWSFYVTVNGVKSNTIHTACGY